ncbi:MAG: DUF2304 domain-containing protein [Oscillospiraceae bacterium]|jgi:hypothetical protein|nr:DUF2304 domain-containing protein [Oscillospiraceae bacterium]
MLRIFLILIGIFVFGSVINRLIKHKLSETQSVFWFIFAALTLIGGLFPGIINPLAEMLGIEYSPSIVFVATTIMLILIAFKHSVEISEAEAKIAELTIALSILKEKADRLSHETQNSLSAGRGEGP